jgi:outer membrane lipoprotein-sorting protein
MKAFWSGIILVAPALLAGTLRASTGDSALDAKLADIDRRAADVRDFSARFEQKKFTALLKKPLVSSGQVRMKGPVVRWDTEVPEPAVLHSDGREIRMFYPRQRVLEVYPIDRRITDLAASPLPRLASLREHFAMAQVDARDAFGSEAESEKQQNRHIALRLTPTDEYLKEHVDRVLVLLDVEGAYVLQVEVDDADGDRTLIRFSDVKLNGGVKQADVDLAVPAGTKVSRPLDAVQGRSK